jgi:outer membrane protein assembly factor BamB
VRPPSSLLARKAAGLALALAWLATWSTLSMVAGCATSDYQRAGSSEDVASALAKTDAATATGRPQNAVGRPLALLALGGTKGPRLVAYDLSQQRVVWSQPADLKARVAVGADILVHAATDALVARGLATGTERWRYPIAKDERLLGYTVEGKMVILVVQEGGVHLHGGKASVRAIDAENGGARWRHELASGNVGAPAARGGLVAVPVQSQYITLLDATDGEQVAQVLSSEEAATFVRALPEGLFFGSAGVFRLGPGTAAGSRKSSGYVRAKLPAFVRPVYWFDLYRPEQGDYSALDRNRILWRMTPSGDARFRDDLALVHNYRFFFGFDARTGELKWAYSHPGTEAVASALLGDAVAFVTADGELGALDARTGARTFTAKLEGEVVRGATFDAEGWAPRGAAQPPAPIADTLSAIVWDPDRRFGDVKMFAIEELARQPGHDVTAQLLKITEQQGLPPAVYQKAGEALIARKDASAADLLARVLETHADYAEGKTAPAVEILARAAGAMKATTAAPALVAHLRRPETSPAALTQIARALAAIGATDALPALHDFVTMYRADPLYDGDPTPLVAASEAMLALGGPAERQLLLYLAEEPHTVEPLRVHLRRALAQTAGAEARLREAAASSAVE